MKPELGQIGPIVIRTYTLLLDVGILLGLSILTWRGWQIEDKPAAWIDVGLGAVIGGILAGRLGHVMIYWSYFREHGNEILQVWLGGIDWHAAFIGALIVSWFISVIRDVKFRQFTDLMAFILPVEALLIFTGCLSTSCGHGVEVESLVGYPPLVAMELPDLYGLVAPRLASQVYGIGLSILLLILIFPIAQLIQRRGVQFWMMLIVFSLGMFMIGYTRGDEVRMVGNLRIDQVLDLVIVGIALLGTVIGGWPQRQHEPVEIERVFETEELYGKG